LTTSAVGMSTGAETVASLVRAEEGLDASKTGRLERLEASGGLDDDICGFGC